jgi:hypothetical protein
MRLFPRLLATLALLLLAACASAGSPTAAPGGAASGSASTGASGSASPASTPASTPGDGNVPGCPKVAPIGPVTVNETDNHASVCVPRGGTLEVYLHARAGQQWSKPVPERPILQPTASGKGALQVGVTAGFFTAVDPGQTRVTAQLVPCRGPKPGPMCDVVEFFEVNVTVQ